MNGPNSLKFEALVEKIYMHEQIFALLDKFLKPLGTRKTSTTWDFINFDLRPFSGSHPHNLSEYQAKHHN